MKKKGFLTRNFSKILKVALVLVILFSIYQILKGLTEEKIMVRAIVSNECYSGSELNAIVSIYKTGKSGNTDLIGGKVVAKLKNGKDKVVRKTTETVRVKKGETGNISINVPENLESGKYKLEIKGKSGIFSRKAYAELTVKDGGNQNIIINLDKGIYKPGDNVNYSGMILDGNSNEPIAEKDIQVNIYDGNDNKVYAQKAPSSKYGIVSGNFKLGDEINSGIYRLEIISGSSTETKEFKVNPYITPQYEIKVESDKDYYLVGETGSFTVKANYFFGEPVTDANISVYKDDVEFVTGTTDSNGNYLFNYEFKDTTPVSFRIGAVDTSNYFVETEKAYRAGEDVISIEVLPEYDNVLSGIDQDIFIFTKKADGTPLKTRSNVTIGNSISKQVVTDENGYGKVSLEASDTSFFSADNEVPFKMVCQDAEDHRIEKTFNLGVVKNYTNIVKTDKLVYNEKDDVNIELKSSTGISKSRLALVKNGKIMKMFSTDSDATSISLDEGLTGIIDIYSFDGNELLGRNNSGYTYTTTGGKKSSSVINLSKKTIFVKPTKALGIDISLPNEEYKPGDKLNISFAAKDEKNQDVDANLLLSILDEAVLSLADNDLSIDNIKIALSDVELAEGITAADLYASIVEGKDESKFMACMLRQKGQGFNPVFTKIERSGLQGSDRIELGRGLLFAVLVILILGKIIKALQSSKMTWIFDAAVILYIALIIYNILDETIYTGHDFLIGLLVSTVLYVFALKNYKNLIYEYLMEIVLLPLPYIIISGMLFQESYLLMAAIPILIWVLTFGAYKEKSDDIKGTKGAVYRYSKIVSKAFIVYGITYFIIEAIDEYSYEIALSLTLPFIIYAIGKIIYAKKDKKPISSIFSETKTENKENSRIVDSNGNVTVKIDGSIVTTLLIVILLFAGVGMLSIVKNFSSNIESTSSMSTASPTTSPRDNSYSSSSGGGALDRASKFVQNGKSTGITQEDTMSVNQFDSMGDSSGASASVSSIFDNLNPFNKEFSANVKPNDTVYEEADYDAPVSEGSDNTSGESAKEAKVRNVFLESLAFIPEIAVEKGKGSVELPISDNITTWDIQVVGNTKDGRIGSSSKTFKVFQEFFVDFSMPANSVVGDYTNIPVTIHNYEDKDSTIKLKVESNDWATIGDYAGEFNVPANNQVMIYVPVTINRFGDCTLRVEAESSSGLKDIVERTMAVKPNGLLVENTLSSGSVEKKYSTDFFTEGTIIEGTRKLTVKVSPSLKTEAVEGLEDMLRMPTGCLEQTSSSLYPDILILKYLRDGKTLNEEIEKKALEYISSGYQRLLTFETTKTPGGFSLYGKDPAETVLTAFALMELNDLSKVYEVDENVISRMKEYLYKEQNAIGIFDIGSTYIGNASSSDDLSMNAYIIWALSEVDPKDNRLNKSVNYLETKLSTDLDSYTIALMANVFANTDSSKYNEAISILKNRAKVDSVSGNSYITSTIKDYWGTYGTRQDVQATSLAAMAFAKGKKENKLVESFIKYIVSSKSGYGSYGTTQGTILALKAIDIGMDSESLKNTTITMSVNGDSKKIDVGEDLLYTYKSVFEKVANEGKVEITTGNGVGYYEIIEEYYKPYTEEVNEGSNIDVHFTMDRQTHVTGVINQNIEFTNNSHEPIVNGLVKVYIPQGCTVLEESLSRLVHQGLIEKYEYNYNTINLYLKNVGRGTTVSNLNITYRALYPERITGGAVDVYDYYNPEIKGVARPVELTVTQ